MSCGTFNVARSIWKHSVFKPSEFSEREAFVWMISEAAWKPRTKRVGQIVVDLDRGQLAGSLRFLAEAWGWEKDRVSRFILRLKNRDMCVTETATGMTVITLCNYDEYQNQPDATATATRQRPRQERDSTATNDNKDERREEGKKEKKREATASPKKGSRIPPDWVLPSAWGQWAVTDQGWPAASVRKEAEIFRDYWVGVSGQRGVKLDWLATWRNWIRKNDQSKHEQKSGGRDGRQSVNGSGRVGQFGISEDDIRRKAELGERLAGRPAAGRHDA